MEKDTYKTSREWFEYLPEHLKNSAIKHSSNLDAKYKNLSQAIHSNFSWSETPEGGEWQNIARDSNEYVLNKTKIINDYPIF